MTINKRRDSLSLYLWECETKTESPSCFHRVAYAAVVDPLAGHNSKPLHAYTFFTEAKPAALLHVNKGSCLFLDNKQTASLRELTYIFCEDEWRAGQFVRHVRRSVSGTQELSGSCLQDSFLVKRKGAAMLSL